MFTLSATKAMHMNTLITALTLLGFAFAVPAQDAQAGKPLCVYQKWVNGHALSVTIAQGGSADKGNSHYKCEVMGFWWWY